MKRLIIPIFLILASLLQAAEVTITTETQLQTAIDVNKDTPIHLNAASFVLTSDLTIDYPCTIDNVSGGNVIIDGNGHTMIFQTDSTATTINATGTSDAERIQFVNFSNVNGGVQVYSSADVQLTVGLTYCDVNDNANNNFSILANPAGNVTVNIQNCNVTNATDDGVSELTGNANNKLVVVNCIDSYIADNGEDSADQGLSVHSPNQYMNATGCTVTGNAGPGFAPGAGATGYITISDCNFYGNNTQNAGIGNSEILLNPISGTIEGCVFPALDSATGSGICIKTETSAVIRNNTFKNHASGHCIYVTDGVALVENNILYNVAPLVNQHLLYANSDSAGIYFGNNTAYGFYYGVNINGVPESQITNNIFASGNSRCIRADNYEYQYNTGNGYNYFFDTTGSVFYPSNMNTQSTDVVGTDPCFIDPANGDFRLKPTSPCFNAGTPMIQGGYVDIGAYQRSSTGITADEIVAALEEVLNTTILASPAAGSIYERIKAIDDIPTAVEIRQEMDVNSVDLNQLRNDVNSLKATRSVPGGG